jgi:hypothetical protein
MLLEDLLLALIEDPDSLTESDYLQLSDLNETELQQFKLAWGDLDTQHQQKLILHLYELGEQNSELNFESIYKYAMDSEDENIVYASLDGLWESETHDTLRKLIRVIETDKISAHIKGATFTHFSRFLLLGLDGKIDSNLISVVHSILKQHFIDIEQPVEVRRRALEALANIDDEQTTGYIKQAYISDITALKVSAIYAMGKTCNTQWLPLLVEELNSEEPEIRYEAVDAIVEIGDDSIINDLVPLLDDDDYQVKLTTISGLGKLGGLIAKEALITYLNDEDQEIIDLVTTALEDIAFIEDPLGL